MTDAESRVDVTNATTVTDQSDASSGGDAGGNMGLIIGAVAGLLILVAAAAAAILCRHRSRPQHDGAGKTERGGPSHAAAVRPAIFENPTYAHGDGGDADADASTGGFDGTLQVVQGRTTAGSSRPHQHRAAGSPLPAAPPADPDPHYDMAPPRVGSNAARKGLAAVQEAARAARLAQTGRDGKQAAEEENLYDM